MSRRVVVTAVVAAVGVVAGLAAPALASGAEPEPALSTYLVTLRAPETGRTDRVAVTPLARELASTLGGHVLRTYSQVIDGFAVRLPGPAAAPLRLDPRVAAVRPDFVVRATDTQPGAVWGLDRSDQRSPPLDGSYSYPARPGRGAHVYVVDTGLAAGHTEFAGRVSTSRNFVPEGVGFSTVDPDAWGDCNGHGTHVASTAVGTRWGIAKQATVHAVRVLGCDGFGEGNDVLAGLDWIALNHQSPAVVNLSLSTEASIEVNDAVQALVAQGIAVVVAAGNDSSDACQSSPASEPSVLTVAATDRTDTRSSFSNAGPCVDLFAPGSAITAAYYADSTGAAVLSGTSMAGPHVAGAVAIVRSANPSFTAAQAQARILQQASTGVVAGSAGAPNRLLHVAPGDQPPRARFKVRCKRLRCTFNAGRSTDDEAIKRYRWAFPGGKVKFGRVVQRRFVKAGRKTVTLRVVDTRKQRTEQAKTIRVRRR